MVVAGRPGGERGSGRAGERGGGEVRGTRGGGAGLMVGGWVGGWVVAVVLLEGVLVCALARGWCVCVCVRVLVCEDEVGGGRGKGGKEEMRAGWRDVCVCGVGGGEGRGGTGRGGGRRAVRKWRPQPTRRVKRTLCEHPKSEPTQEALSCIPAIAQLVEHLTVD